MPAKVKYNVKGVDPGQDFTEPIPVGLYLCKVIDCQEGVSKNGNDQIELTLAVVRATKGDKPKQFAGRRLWDYIGLGDTTAWKLRQFLEAIGQVKDGKKEEGVLDLNKVIGTPILVKTTNQTSEEYGTRSKVAALVPQPEDFDPDLDEDEEPEDEPDDEPEDDDDEEDEDEDEDLTYEDLAEYDRATLKAVIEENGLDIRVTKRTSDDKLREKIATELELEPAEDDEEEDDEEPDYTDMSLADLKAAAKERGLQTGGTKASLIKRLRKDDDDDTEPF